MAIADGRPLGGPQTFPVGKPNPPSRIVLGVPSNTGQPWVGVMDEVRIWDRALAAEEVAAYVNSFGIRGP